MSASPGSAAPARGGAWLDRALRGAMIAAVLGLGALGLAMPGAALRGGAAWLGFLFAVLAGAGWLVARLVRFSDEDAGARLALGATGYLVVIGPLIAAGVATRPVVLALIAVGALGFAVHEATAPVATWQRVRAAFAYARSQPVIAMFVALLGALACARLLGALSGFDRNLWDDDILYTPLVRRLLDAGDLVEPFSFRRLGAYGGQTALQALAGARGSLANVHLLDKGIGFGGLVLAVLGHARARGTKPLWLGLAALSVIALPEIAVNTASYWLGAMLFFALYRSLVANHAIALALVGAATCTLRQNYLAAVVAIVGASLVARWLAGPRDRDERRRWLLIAVTATLAIAPWWIAAYRSSGTFLFPILGGTWNPAIPLTPPIASWPQELGALVGGALDPAPLVALPVLALVAAFARDRRPGRPLTALVIGNALGFAVLARGFLGTDAFTLWRYAFGFALALVLALGVELGVEDDADRSASDGVDLAAPGRWLVLAALVIQLLANRAPLARRGALLFADLGHAWAHDRRGDPDARAEAARYRAMQDAVPAGAAVVVMLDEPALLDYRRNPIANLDTPGFASPAPGLAAFLGPEAFRAYFVARGYRYAAFVRGDRSRAFYSRASWRERIFANGDLFNAMASYAIDAIDNFAALATAERVRYDQDGLVVLDLATPMSPSSSSPSASALPVDEGARRAAWNRAFAEREGMLDAWALTNRSDVRFEDGTSLVKYIDGRGLPSPGSAPRGVVDDTGAEADDSEHAPAGGQRRAVLTMQRRAHLRVRGDTDKRLVLRVAVDLKQIATRPRLDVALDDALLATAVADADGRYAIDVVVPRALLADGWRDLYLVLSSIGDPDRDLRDLRVARLEAVEWTTPAP